MFIIIYIFIRSTIHGTRSQGSWISPARYARLLNFSTNSSSLLSIYEMRLNKWERGPYEGPAGSRKGHY